MKSNNKTYFPQKCLYLDANTIEKEGWQIICEDKDTFWVNKWLGQLRTPQTAKQYTNRLCKFLNYLESKETNYLFATEKHLDLFFTGLRFGQKGGIFSIDIVDTASYRTILGYYYAIASFYKFLNIKNKSLKLKLKRDKSHNIYDYLYNIDWTKDNMYLYIDKKIEYYKPKKEYIKWYSDSEIDTIQTNLKRKRDKSIFLLTLCGMRIDEILSLRVEDYKPRQGCVITYRSKGKETGNTGRVVAIDINVIRVIEDYLNTERIYVELDLLSREIVITDCLFVVLNKNGSYGSELKYHNILEILKRAAKNAGLDSARIRTHSGRSTTVMRDIVTHIKNPELLSMEDIRIKHGWKNIASINPYLDRTNPEISRHTRQLLDEVKQEHIDSYNRKNGENNE